MRLKKLLLTKDASERLKTLKARTGLAPNLLARLGFCLSLSDRPIPDPAQYREEDREFNRYTLLGEWDDLYVALLRQRLLSDGIEEANIEAYFRAHVNRGIMSLSGLVRSVSDLASLCDRSASAIR